MEPITNTQPPVSLGSAPPAPPECPEPIPDSLLDNVAQRIKDAINTRKKKISVKIISKDPALPNLKGVSTTLDIELMKKFVSNNDLQGLKDYIKNKMISHILDVRKYKGGKYINNPEFFANILIFEPMLGGMPDLGDTFTLPNLPPEQLWPGHYTNQDPEAVD